MQEIKTTRLLDWYADATPNASATLKADHDSDSCYRIVYSHGFHCLRYELRGAEHKWMGQFVTVAQAKATAQEHDNGLRRLKAWEKYMMRHDPPADLGPEWQP